jgi:hypothetical protein
VLFLWGLGKSPGDRTAAESVPGSGTVRDFELYIDDERYRTPTLVFIQVRDEERAREFAQKKLDEDERHRGVEVWEKGVRLFALGTLVDRRSECSSA